MTRLCVLSSCLALALVTASAAPQDSDPLVTFHERVDAYVQLHRLVEGPVPPLAMSNNIAEVQRLMATVRMGIRAARGDQGQGYIFTPGVMRSLRGTIASCLSVADLEEVEADLRDHIERPLHGLAVNRPLPAGTPFVPLPPVLLRDLPRLPEELRYVALPKSLILWDHHADLVVDIAPGLLDPRSYTQPDVLH